MVAQRRRHQPERRREHLVPAQKAAAAGGQQREQNVEHAPDGVARSNRVHQGGELRPGAGQPRAVGSQSHASASSVSQQGMPPGGYCGKLEEGSTCHSLGEHPWHVVGGGEGGEEGEGAEQPAQPTALPAPSRCCAQTRRAAQCGRGGEGRVAERGGGDGGLPVDGEEGLVLGEQRAAAQGEEHKMPLVRVEQDFKVERGG
eukprot:scaffold24373_cov84-Isochrysis_galbana.AAC.1